MRAIGRYLGQWALSALAALQLLTRLPLPKRMPDGSGAFSRSTVFFPLAGFAIGAVLAGAGTLAGKAFPFYAAGAVVLALWVLVTGGLHLDGLMDTADGLFSNQPRERMLEIMKDSRAGAMGVIAAVTILLLKGAFLAALLADPGRARLVLLVLVPVWSRAFLPAAIAGWKHARGEAGMGALYRGAGLRHAAAAGTLAVLLSAALLSGAGGLALTEALAATAAMACAAFGTGAFLARAVARQLGGLTGDTYGAINEALETVLLAIAAGVPAHWLS